MIGVTYHTYDFQTDDVITTSVDAHNAPTSALDIKDIAESDVSVFIKRRLNPKVITLEGIVQKNTPALIEEEIDKLQRVLSFNQKVLTLQYDSGDRLYTATPSNIVISRPNGLNRFTFSIEFVCADPLGKDSTELELLDGSISLAFETYSLDIGGSYKAEPLITISYSSITGGTTDKTVTVTNSVTQEAITITRDWTSGDTLQIDNLNKSVIVNDEEVEVSGRYLGFAAGIGSINVADDFTARTGTIVLTYTRRYR